MAYEEIPVRIIYVVEGKPDEGTWQVGAVAASRLAPCTGYGDTLQEAVEHFEAAVADAIVGRR